MTPSIFLGLPTYNKQIHVEMLGALQLPTRGTPVTIDNFNGPLLAFTFNQLWCRGLASGCTHFAMLHADIAPTTEYWLDIMLQEMQTHGADVVSAVSPIKDKRGLTSTGLCQGDWRLRMLSIKEIHKLPVTFSNADCGTSSALLINTGCMLVDLARVADFPGFTVRDRIETATCQACSGVGCQACGRRGVIHTPRVESEDWWFSRWLHAQGRKVVATRAVQLKHFGPAAFENSRPWGEWETDRLA